MLILGCSVTWLRLLLRVPMLCFHMLLQMVWSHRLASFWALDVWVSIFRLSGYFEHLFYLLFYLVFFCFPVFVKRGPVLRIVASPLSSITSILIFLEPCVRSSPFYHLLRQLAVLSFLARNAQFRPWEFVANNEVRNIVVFPPTFY